MSERKLLPVEVESEAYARDLLQWFALAKPDEIASSTTPLEAMQAAAQLRRMAATIERLNRDLTTERALHRNTEKWADDMKDQRDSARRERDERVWSLTSECESLSKSLGLKCLEGAVNVMEGEANKTLIALAERNLRALIECGSVDKKLMLDCLEQIVDPGKYARDRKLSNAS